MYIRKTKDVYFIEVNYGYGDGYEKVYEAENYATAKRIYNDYCNNDTFAIAIRIKKHRVKI